MTKVINEKYLISPISHLIHIVNNMNILELWKIVNHEFFGNIRQIINQNMVISRVIKEVHKLKTYSFLHRFNL